MFNLFKKKEPAVVNIADVLQKIEPPTIIREPKLKPTTCSLCDAVYQAEPHHLRPGMFTLGVKRMTMCPICNQENVAEFEKEIQDGNE